MSVERMLPMYEGKMGWQYDHRSATFIGTGDTSIAGNLDHRPHVVVLPRYWIRESVVEDRFGRREWGCHSALLGFRRVARNTDERTSIALLLPFGAASYGWIVSAGPDARDLCLLVAQYNSFVFDYLLRQFLSKPSIPQGTFEQLPVLTRGQFSRFDAKLGDTRQWVIERVAALSCTGNEMSAFASELRTPLQSWDDTQRELMKAELDALMFHLYGVSRDDVAYILDTFPIVKKNDEKTYGEYRTKRVILERYDDLANSPLVPPPADASVAHTNRV